MSLSTTGVIGGVQFSTQTVIDHAFRGCKLTPQQISGEDIDTATTQLGLMLSAWATEGTPLWCQTKYILPLTQGLFQLAIPSYFPGIVDVLEANLQQITQLTGIATSTTGVPGNAFDNNPSTVTVLAAPGGQITLQLPTASNVSVVGVMSGPGQTPSTNPLNTTGGIGISFQWSNDGIAWTTFYSNPFFTLLPGQYVWLDESTFGIIPQALYYRLQADAFTTLQTAEFTLGINPMEIPVARINKDDYWNLPNKRFQGRPVQYWCDRQIAGPTMWVWPAPGAAFVFYQITILAHRHIMDVGSMTNVIEVPQRTFDAVWTSLAERLRIVIPQVDKDATQDIPALAGQARKLFWGEERDDSPIHLRLDISPYTA